MKIPAVMEAERRFFAITEGREGDLAVESRDENGEKRDYIVGYAAKFGVDSLDMGDWIERLAPTAFALVSERRGRRRPLETRALWNHDPNFPLARYPRTLSLRVDDIGLRYEFQVPPTSYARDIATNIEMGIVSGSSFTFRCAPGGDEWTIEEGRSVRTVHKIDDLLDVAPVTFPAYPDADVSIAQRSYKAFLQKSSAARDAAKALLEERRSKIKSIREFLGRTRC